MMLRKMYVCASTKTTTDNGVDILSYGEPQPLWVNYLSENGNYVLAMRGEDEEKLVFAYFDTRAGVPVKSNDLAYLIDENITTEEELDSLVLSDDENRSKANYRVKNLQLNKMKTKVKFEKLQEDNGMEEIRVSKGLVTKKIDKKDLQDFVSAGWKEATKVAVNPYSGYGKKQNHKLIKP